MRKEQEAKVLAILTPQQKSTWESLKGKPFKFEMMQAPRSGGQGGRGGQGGGGQYPAISQGLPEGSAHAEPSFF